MTDVSRFEKLSDKLQAGMSLAESEITALSQTRDLVRLGALADERRRRLRGDRATFVRVSDVPASEGVGAAIPHAGELRLAGCPATTTRLLESVRQAVRTAGDVPVTGFALDELVELCGGDAARFDDLLAALRTEDRVRPLMWAL